MTQAPPGRRLVPPAPAVRSSRGARRVLTVAAGVAVVLLLFPAVSIGRVLSAPGTDSVSARLSEWARDHRLGGAVTWLERRTYRPPKVGGTPPATSPLGGQRTASSAGPPAAVAGPALPLPVRPLATPALSGEGGWHVLTRVSGRPAIAAAYLRPDAIHTSYVAGVVWINPRLVSAQLHPGTLDPGGTGWAGSTSLSAGRRAGLLAAFNSGFRLTASHGGFYLAGRHAGHLRPGAASMVFGRNGSLTVGTWNRDVRLTPDVLAVRQNLALLVEGGRITPGVDSDAGVWGATLGNAKYVWRSGIGVRRDGGVVYVAGNRLTARSLAELLLRGGCTRAMELDINPAWTSFILYPPKERNLLPDMQGSPRRYDTVSSRDFVALYAR